MYVECQLPHVSVFPNNQKNCQCFPAKAETAIIIQYAKGFTESVYDMVLAKVAIFLRSRGFPVCPIFKTVLLISATNYLCLTSAYARNSESQRIDESSLNIVLELMYT